MDKRKINKVTRRIKTPRTYISWNQLSKWEADKDHEKYRKYYFEDEKEKSNPRMDFGRMADEILDKGAETNSEVMEIIRILEPQYPKKQFEINAKCEICTLMGVLDRFNPRKLALFERKTGKKWTQKRVDNLGQIDFYDYMVWLKYGKPLKEIHLFWIETKEDDYGDIVPTGKFKLFNTKRTTEHRLKIYSRIKSAWI